MKRQDFYYDLPKRLIAQHPASDRSSSRMMLVNRQNGEVGHRFFAELPSFLNPGDCLVLNDSKVIPARLMGVSGRAGSSGKIEMLLHRRLDEKHWEALFKPGKKSRPGDVIIFGDGLLTARVESLAQDGLRVVSLDYNGSFEALLDELGEMPLPPYIQKQPSDASAKERYQTVYASQDGSVAAPTAGLHFTQDILGAITGAGVSIARVTLHVGLGTFRPVKAEDITDHHMHSECFHMATDQAEIINNTKRSGGRVIAVGTTSCRTLESSGSSEGLVSPGSGQTDIFIYPGYSFRVIDGLLTNFHLPESTLIMLVAALTGREVILDAYQKAIEQEYRFFSYGDCMLIL